MVGDHHIRPLDVIARVLGAFFGVVSYSSGFHLDFVQCPCRIFTSCECLIQMVFFMLQQFRVGVDGFCSMLQWTYYTILWWNCMVTVLLIVQVSMCRFTIYCGLQTSFFIRYYKDIQEGYGSILSWLFTSELYMLIYVVEMFRETCFFWDDCMIVKVSVFLFLWLSANLPTCFYTLWWDHWRLFCKLVDLIILLLSGHNLLCPLPQVPPLYLLLVSTCCCPSSVTLWLFAVL